jgi:hypothetical protein
MDDAIQEMVKRGTYMCRPSITIATTSTMETRLARARYKERLQAFIPRIETTRRVQSGVKIAMGFTRRYMFGENAEPWSSKGMTPERLQNSTTGVRRPLGKEGAGRGGAGVFGSLAVEGSPLADIKVVINNVKWVMANGEVVVDKTKSAGGR